MPNTSFIGTASALAAIPLGLRSPLITEYQLIVQSYLEHRWSPSELSGGKFCEIVFTILDGYATGSYAVVPTKPSNFVAACRKLEQSSSLPRSFQILIPRILPALYEIRNNRGAGHVGGEVDPNPMDATFVLSTCNWVMAELVRVYHDLSINDAQRLVDTLAERRIPLIWEGETARRILDPDMNLRAQVLVLLSAATRGKSSVTELLSWTGYNNKAYFSKLLRGMHDKRLIELSSDNGSIVILPPGSAEAEKIVREYALA